ncbi:MAG TPA: hypothetical protein VHC22_22710 [Pirellulales bacterium]|nr:hypothetical protein [Pirellulales bacterium]
MMPRTYLVTLIVLTMAAGRTGNREAVEDLSSETSATRAAAMASLRRDREELEDALSKQLAEALSGPDRLYSGRTHSVLQIVGRVRATNTVGRLVEAVGLTLDPATFPHGGDRMNIAYYPVAETLIAIGDKRVVKEIIAWAVLKQDELTLQLYAKILRDVIGEQAANAVVEHAAVGRSSDAIKNLSRLKAILQRGAIELPLPGFKDKRAKGAA